MASIAFVCPLKQNGSLAAVQERIQSDFGDKKEMTHVNMQMLLTCFIR